MPCRLYRCQVNMHFSNEHEDADPQLSGCLSNAEDRVSIEQSLQYIYGGDVAAMDPETMKHTLARGRQMTDPALPRSLTGRIPFEVVELIVDTMRQGGLATCALVCWAWYHAVSRVLYRDVAISHRASFDSLVDFIRHDARALERLQQTNTLRIIAPDNPRVQPHSSPPTHVVPLVLGRALPNITRLVFV